MLSKNNFNEKLRQMDNQKDHFAIRKLTIGVASVLIGITFMGFGGQAVHAAEVTNTQPAVEQVSKETTTDSTQQNNDAQKDVATAQKTEVVTDSQANNQTDNTKESAQLVKPITEADVKATTESKKAEIADKTNEVKLSDTQVQEKQKEQTSEVKTPDTTSNKDEQKSDQTQRLVVDKKATENTQAARDIAAEKMQNNVQPQAKIQALIARRAESESQFNVDDWDGSLNNTTHEYTLNNYHGIDKENIYIPNTQDFIDAGRISSDDKVYITKDLMHSITKNGAVNVTVDDQGEKNKVYAKGDWKQAFGNYSTNLKHVDLSHVDTSGVTNMYELFLGSHDLESVNFSGDDLSNVTNADSMFAWAAGNIKSVNITNTKSIPRSILDIYLKALSNAGTTTIDLSGINLSPNVTSLHGLFSNMTKLKNVNLSGLDISHITDMGGMFSGDSNLESIDLSGLDLSKVTNTNNMFDGVGGTIKSVNITNTKSIPRSILDIYLKALSNAGTTTIDLSGINLSPNVTSLHGLFSNMTELKNVNLSGLDISHITDMSGMFSNDTSLKSVNLSGLNLEKVKNLSNMFLGANNLDNIDFSNTKFAPDSNTNSMFAWGAGNIKSVNLKNAKNVTDDILRIYARAIKNSNATTADLSDINLSPNVTSLHGLFSNMTKLKNVNLSGLDISHITDMGGMFSGDSSLESLDLSGLDISHITDMSGMFSGDSNLESLDLSGLDLSKVTNTNNMFDRGGGKNIKSVDITNTKSIPRSILDIYLKALSNAGTTTIDLSGINLSPSITSFNNLFSNMPSLESVNLSGLDISHITDMSGMFSNDTSLKSVNLSGLNLEKVKNLSTMFLGANNLENIDFSNTKFAPDSNTNSMFAWGAGNIKSVNLKNAKNVTDDILRIYARAIKNSNATTADLSDINLSPNVTSLNGLFSNMTKLKNVNLSGLDISHITDMGGMFSGDSSLESLDLSGLDLSKVTNTNNMFYRVGGTIKSVNITNTKSIPRSILDIYLKALSNAGTTTIDLSGINLSPNVTSLHGLFSNMTKLESVNLSGLDISHITDMRGMFSGDSKLESLDLSGLDLSNVTDTSGMFAWADGNIKSVNLKNTKNVTDDILRIYARAIKNSNATTADLSDINLSPSITSFNNLFSNMPNIESIDLTGWDTGNITDMSYMFFNDPKLTTIKGLEGFDTSNVTNMSNMFASYTNPTTNDYNPKSLSSTGHLESLDLSNWKTGNVTNMNFMFGGQTYLTSLGDLRHWDTRNVTDMRGLFYDLENIPALDLSNWVTDKVTDMSYMFSKMSKIKNLDSISEWHTHNVVDMSYMFNGMTDLEGLDLSNWDPSSVGNNTTEQNYSLARMFSNDINLTKVGDLSKWADKTGNVHSTRWMFYNTPKLENVDLHGWNTGKLQIAEGMFWNSGAKQINIDNWDLSKIKRITPAGYVEGKAGEGVLRGVENMFKNLTNPAVISMNNVILPDARNAFEINDFEGNKAIVVIANGKNDEALQDLLEINNQTWTDKSGNTITGRQNSDYVTYVRADDNSKQIGQHGLNFIFTKLDDLHQYFNQVTNADNVKNDIGELSHDWDTQQDTDNNIVKITLRLSPASSYDPYRENIHAEKDGNILADLMTSKYQLHIVAPTKTTEIKNPTRKIIIENPDGSTRTKKQTVEFTRNVTKHIDGTEEDTPWTPASGNWDHFDVPQHDGYDSYIDGVAGTSIGAENINADTDNVTIHVTYKSNTPDNPEPDNPEPEEPRPETPEVPNTPDEPNEPEKPTVPNKDNDHNKSDESENIRSRAEDKAKNKKSSKTNNAGVHGQTAPHAATAPNRLVAPKGDQLAIGKGLKELNNKPASAAKANANNKETLPQTGEEKDNVGLLGLGLLALAALGFVDRKRRD